MKNTLAALVFYARFARSFSRLGFERRVGRGAPTPFDFSGQRWLVTGASGGIGAAIVRGAAVQGAQVFALARDPARLAALAAANEGTGRIVPVSVDLASMRGIRDAAASFAGAAPFDVVVHNVGVMCHAFERTDEGVERGLATNLLGHWVLDRALRQHALLGQSSALIAMASGGLYGAKLDLDALEATTPEAHNGFAAYAQHKRAQLALVAAWNREASQGGPRAWAMHPGWVDTPGVETALPSFRRTFRRILRSTGQGADTALWLAAARPDGDGGLWLDRHRDTEHAFGFTRGGATPDALTSWLAARAERA